MTRIRRVLEVSILCTLIFGCVGTPEGTEPVSGFELDRYLGKWYEVARFDHKFERGLSQVTAEYTIREKGGITVTNRGYNGEEWKQAIGKAFPAGEPGQGKLKVSFFGPFYGGYNILKLDPDYQYALVAGPNREYLWLLSRTPQMPEATMDEYVAFAAEKGFPVENLIYVEQGE